MSAAEILGRIDRLARMRGQSREQFMTTVQGKEMYSAYRQAASRRTPAVRKGGAVARVEALIAQKIQKGAAKDGTEAISAVMKENPRLYQQYREEVSQDIRNATRESDADEDAQSVVVTEVYAAVDELRPAPSGEDLSRAFKENPALYSRYRHAATAGARGDE